MANSKDSKESGLNRVNTAVSFAVQATEDSEPRNDGLHRRLNNRQIQLIAIGGSIGTGLFITLGSTLAKAGPASLLMAWTLYSCIMGLVNNSMAEMSTYMPTSGSFIRMSGHWVDEALGFMVGWNFFLYEALVVPFEITALSTVLSFWSDNIPTAAICGGVTAAYGILNILAVGFYGEAEFWLSSGKVFLIVILFSFTFLTMVGVNPQHDAYGFRYWSDPGPFAEWLSTGTLGRFEGFLAALWSASFIIAGPEYIAMAAPEVKRPRVIVKRAFKTAYWRFGIFFFGSALFTGIVVPYNDPALLAVLSGEKSGGTAAASPYVIAMERMGITVLPHIVNALIFTSIFSAGNTYTFCAIRSLHALALDGKAPSFLKRCVKGVPVYCFAITMLFPCLSFLQVSNGSSTVLNWLINLVTAGGLIDYIVICITYVFFHRACKSQGIDRQSLPYVGYFQPYSAWIAGTFITLVVIFYGYPSVRSWDVGSFFSYYTLVFVAIFNFTFWKLFKKTKVILATECDLVWEKPLIDEYEAQLEDDKPNPFWTWLRNVLHWKKFGAGSEKNTPEMEISA